MGGNLSCYCKSEGMDIERVVTEERLAQLEDDLRKLAFNHPHVADKNHFLNEYYKECLQALESCLGDNALDAYDTLTMELDMENDKIKQAFQRFDASGDGALCPAEIKMMMKYLGFPCEQSDVKKMLSLIDKDSDANISQEEFSNYVNKIGGSVNLFEARVRGLGTGSALDKDVLRCKLLECGIDPAAQVYWRLVAPESELDAVAALAPCQQKAVRHIRSLAQANHERAMPLLQRRVEQLGFNKNDLWLTLAWIRELAPILIHFDPDKCIDCFMQDTHYRNQFETKRSGGLLNLDARTKWETKLFGGAYTKAEPFQRPRYGVQNIWNDYRGVMGCKQYGDSYLVLKDVRLRCTFAPEDSGNLPAKRLAVPDYYGHVLHEYSDKELAEVIQVATGNVAGTTGNSKDVIEHWGKYKEAQIHGEIDLKKHVVRMVIDERHRHKAKILQALADQHGWKLTWMSDMGKEMLEDQQKQVPQWRNVKQQMRRKDTGSMTPNEWMNDIEESAFDKATLEASQLAAGITESVASVIALLPSRRAKAFARKISHTHSSGLDPVPELLC